MVAFNAPHQEMHNCSSICPMPKISKRQIMMPLPTVDVDYQKHVKTSKNMELKISNRVWSVGYPNAGRNKQPKVVKPEKD